MKLVFADFEKGTGISRVCISTELGHFMGTAYLHPEDKEYASELTGCMYAEGRAIIKYLKASNQQLQLQLKGLLNYEKILLSLKNYNPYSIEAKTLRKEIDKLSNEILSNKEEIENISKAIKQDIANRDKLHARLKNKKH